MQRYDQSGFDSSMIYDDEGEYVEYDEAAARIAELEAERDRLAAIVERVPKTADGVPLYRGMKVYWRSQDPTTTRDGRTLVTYGVDEEGDFEGTDENGDWIPFDFGICSTAEAAAEETE